MPSVKLPGARCHVLISSDIALYSVHIASDKMAAACHTIVTFIALIFLYQSGARGHCLQQLFSSYSICSITIDNDKTVAVCHTVVTRIPLAVSFRKWSQR